MMLAPSIAQPQGHGEGLARARGWQELVPSPGDSEGPPSPPQAGVTGVPIPWH